MQFAFNMARSRPRKLLTVVTKSNAERFGFVLWDEVAQEVAADYPDVASNLHRMFWVAAGYIAEHGSVRWSEITDALAARPSCPKLSGYWRFYDCRYHKGSHTCSELAHIEACPLPRQPLRNGHLNQMAYSLFLFIRDVADGDLVAWIDAQLGSVNSQSANRPASLREAIIGPLRNVYGVADKVLAVALSSLLLSAGQQRPLWREVGATLSGGRHAGAQFSASNRHPAAAGGRASLRRALLPGRRMR
jgi:hypothetical protein